MMTRRQERILRRKIKKILRLDRRMYLTLKDNFNYHDSVDALESFDAAYILGCYTVFSNKLYDYKRGVKKIL